MLGLGLGVLGLDNGFKQTQKCRDGGLIFFSNCLTPFLGARPQGFPM